MYDTKGVSKIATITDLRQNATVVIDAAKQNDEPVVIQKNNQPEAVVLSWAAWATLAGRTGG